MEEPFTWHHLLPADWQPLIPEHIFFSLIVMVALVLLAWWVKRTLLRVGDPVIPDEGVSLRDLLEVLVEFVVILSDSIIGKKGRKYVPLFGSFFIFILAANLSGLIPGFSPPTSNLNVTLGLALVSFAAYNFLGVREHGLSYIKQFLGPMTSLPSSKGRILGILLFLPILIISVLFFFAVEGFSHLFRPVSLSVRLFGNMFAGHSVIEVFTELSKVGVPVIFYAFETLIAAVQALVFTVLSLIYVALAISHEH